MTEPGQVLNALPQTPPEDVNWVWPGPENRPEWMPAHAWWSDQELDWVEDQDDWPHSRECIRITYTQAPEQVEAGIKVIAEEVRAVFSGQ